MKKPAAKSPVKAKPVPKAPVKAHHKPAPVTKAVRAHRHAAAVKAAKTRAANARKARHHPVRKLALGEGVACCSAEALAASLRLLGQPVSDGDVLALYWRTASDADAGASILATLEAASRFGLAGCRPLSGPRAPQVIHGDGAALPGEPQEHVVTELERVTGGALAVVGTWQPLTPRSDDEDAVIGAVNHGLILGVNWPAPHAVLATPDGWWSWGSLYEPWTDDIDEAWLIEWEVG